MGLIHHGFKLTRCLLITFDICLVHCPGGFEIPWRHRRDPMTLMDGVLGPFRLAAKTQLLVNSCHWYIAVSRVFFFPDLDGDRVVFSLILAVVDGEVEGILRVLRRFFLDGRDTMVPRRGVVQHLDLPARPSILLKLGIV